MKAIVYHDYGSPDNLELAEIEMPAVKDDEVLVKIHAASINWHDWHFLTGTPFLARIMAGLLKPKNEVLGIDLAGRVEAVGVSVTQFQPGDEVFGSTSHGCFAEYVCVSEEGVVMKPANMTFEEVAAAPGTAATALHALRDYGQIQAGQKVLINGASGGVGTFAMQIAKWFGAEVTGDKKMAPLLPKPPSKSDLVFMRGFLESGAVSPAIDRRYLLSEVPEALRYLEIGHARGKVVITM